MDLVGYGSVSRHRGVRVPMLITSFPRLYPTLPYPPLPHPTLIPNGSSVDVRAEGRARVAAGVDADLNKRLAPTLPPRSTPTSPPPAPPPCWTRGWRHSSAPARPPAPRRRRRRGGRIVRCCSSSARASRRCWPLASRTCSTYPTYLPTYLHTAPPGAGRPPPDLREGGGGGCVRVLPRGEGRA